MSEIDIPTSDKATDEVAEEPTDARERQEAVADELSEYKFGWADSDENYTFDSGEGVNPDVVKAISERKDEPE